jgi:hypothetical protein
VAEGLTVAEAALWRRLYGAVLDCLGEHRGDRLVGGGGSGRQRAG